MRVDECPSCLDVDVDHIPRPKQDCDLCLLERRANARRHAAGLQFLDANAKTRTATIAELVLIEVEAAKRGLPA